MDLQKEFEALHAEQTAHHIALTRILAVLARDLTLRFSINEGFEQALGVAQSLCEAPPEGSTVEQCLKVFRIVEDIRSAVLEPPPKA
jgi:hypothetical protein